MNISRVDYKPSFGATFSRDRSTIRIFNDIDAASRSGIKRPNAPDYTALKANLIKLKTVYPNQEYSLYVKKDLTFGRDFLELKRTDGKGFMACDMRVQNADSEMVARTLISATDRILNLRDSEAVDFVAGRRGLADIASARVL